MFLYILKTHEGLKTQPKFTITLNLRDFPDILNPRLHNQGMIQFIGNTYQSQRNRKIYGGL